MNALRFTDEGAEVIGYSSLIDRSDGRSLIKNDILSLIKFDIPCYDPENIPEELKKLIQLNQEVEKLSNFQND